MGMLAWVMMGLALWHFTIFLPDRFWGGIVGAFLGALIGAIVFGLIVSIPLIVWGSQLVLKLLDRYPAVVTFGGALLGWIAGGLIVNDPAGDRWPVLDTPVAEYGMSIVCALFVVIVGYALKRRNAARIAGDSPNGTH